MNKFIKTFFFFLVLIVSSCGVSGTRNQTSDSQSDLNPKNTAISNFTITDQSLNKKYNAQIESSNILATLDYNSDFSSLVLNFSIPNGDTVIDTETNQDPRNIAMDFSKSKSTTLIVKDANSQNQSTYVLNISTTQNPSSDTTLHNFSFCETASSTSATCSSSQDLSADTSILLPLSTQTITTLYPNFNKLSLTQTVSINGQIISNNAPITVTLPYKAKINVVAGDGTTQNTYTVNVSMMTNTDTTIHNLQICENADYTNCSSAVDITADTTIQVSYTNPLPTKLYVKTKPLFPVAQTVSLNGTNLTSSGTGVLITTSFPVIATFAVISPDGSTQNNYTVTIPSPQTLSSDTTLHNFQLCAESNVTSCSSQITITGDQTLSIPYDANQSNAFYAKFTPPVPDQNQTIKLADGSILGADGKIPVTFPLADNTTLNLTVIAPDNTTTSTYKITVPKPIPPQTDTVLHHFQLCEDDSGKNCSNTIDLSSDSSLLIPYTNGSFGVYPQFTNSSNQSVVVNKVTIDPSGKTNILNGENLPFIFAFNVTAGNGTTQKMFNVTVKMATKYLFTANSYNNSISSFSIGDDGLLTNKQDTVTSPVPYSIQTAPSGKFAYVSIGNSIAVFQINLDGSLQNIQTVPTTHGTEIIISPSGNYLYELDNLDAGIYMFQIDTNTGMLTALSPNFVHKDGIYPGAMGINSSETYAYVLDQGGSSVSIYSMKSGALNFMSNSKLEGDDTHPDSIKVIGNNVYIVYSRLPNPFIIQYSINNDGTLNKKYTTNFASNVTTPNAITFDPSGKCAYVSYVGSSFSSAMGIISYNVGSDGQLSQKSSNTDGYFSNLLFAPSEKYIYATNSPNNLIYQYMFASDCSLATNPSKIGTGGGVFGAAIN